MTTFYDFSCSWPGCKAYVHVTMHMHDGHEWDVDQLGKALGFRRGSPFVRSPWQCAVHDASKESP